MKGSSKPDWIRAKIPTETKFKEVSNLIKNQGLHTVCEEAFCPNRTECWESGTATFLLMGVYCTRACKFCDVDTKNPHQYLDIGEPLKIAEAIKTLSLKYVVLTSVTRDDLPDGGASHLANCIRTIKQEMPSTLIEILIPDFKGNVQSLKTIANAKPEVIGHNMETTETFTPKIRDPRAKYQQSLSVLKTLKNIDPEIFTKSSIMLGFGETDKQILTSLKDLKDVHVDIITLGQYLQPSRKAIPVHDYIEPKKFAYWENKAKEMGFSAVVAGPLVRSSYQAGLQYSRVRKIVRKKLNEQE
ncbi:lipoyl synthase [Candidatus Heimdallarchaeota archaeon B3_Heim]|nr:MAG: lipoyl synthase [Candidatus Heimdallarchaeota archaeon B3_Heim]